MSERPKHLRGPSECHDSKGYPIYPGDLLRTPHFIGPRGRRYYLYHVACLETTKEGHDYLRMVPARYLESTIKRTGGDPLLSDEIAEETTIISGYGPGELLDYLDRPRKQKPKPESEAE